MSKNIIPVVLIFPLCVCGGGYFNFFYTILSVAYISCTGGFPCDIYICAFNVSYSESPDSPPPSFSFIPPPPFLEQFQVSLFNYNICTQSILTIFTLLHPLHLPSHLPLVPSPDRTCFYLLIFHFLSVC
jgi:hypothetical protein